MKPIAAACPMLVLVLGACGAWRPGVEATASKPASAPTPASAPAKETGPTAAESTPPISSPPANKASDRQAANSAPATANNATPTTAPPVSQASEAPAKSKQPSSHPQARTAPVDHGPPVVANQPVAGPPAQRPAATPPLDIASLEQRLKDTHAIGLFTKLSLKNQVDDLLTQFRTHFRSNGSPPLSDLRQRYDLLMMKVLSLLQDGDPPLAATIGSSREAIWNILSDPNKLATISS